SATQTPPALPGMMSLAVLATVCAKQAVVQAREGWQEPLNVYTVTSLRPGERKSAVVADAVGPLEVWEQEQAETQAPAIGEAAARYKMLEHRVQRAQSEAAREKDDAERMDLETEAIRLARELSEMRAPVLPRLLADDCTPEKLASLLQAHDGRM